MGVCLEAARRACAKIGIRNWPHSLILDDDAGAVCNVGGRAPNSGIAALDRGRNAPPLLLDLAALEKVIAQRGPAEHRCRCLPCELRLLAHPAALSFAAQINKGIANGRAVHWLKLAEAAAALGASSLALRRACRRLGIAKWPSREAAPGRFAGVHGISESALTVSVPRCAIHQPTSGLDIRQLTSGLSRQPAHKRMRHVIKVRTRSNRLCHNLPPPSLLRLAEAPA
eukprot:3941613-Rhodomonas_salina.7